MFCAEVVTNWLISWISNINKIGSLFFDLCIFLVFTFICIFCYKTKCAQTHDSDFWKGKMDAHMKNILCWISHKVSKFHESRIWMKSDKQFMFYDDFHFCDTKINNISWQMDKNVTRKNNNISWPTDTSNLLLKFLKMWMHIWKICCAG